MQSLGNISRQLFLQYQAIQGGAIRGALQGFTIDKYFPESKESSSLAKALEGIGTAFAALAGFIPGVGGAALGAASAILPAIGGAIESKMTKDNEKIATDQFTTAVQNVYDTLITALDDASEALFKGESIGQAPYTINITQMISGGAWVSSEKLTRVKDAERQMKIDIVSRGINALWKTYSSNKMWVLFVDLQEEAGSTAKCEGDTSGPSESRYCADGGVYYTYNFIEDGSVHSIPRSLPSYKPHIPPQQHPSNQKH